MRTLARDLTVWLARARECRNPVLLTSAVQYALQRRRLLALATRRPASAAHAYIREIEDDRDFLNEIRSAMMQWTPYQPRAVDFMMSGRSGSVFFNEVTLYAIVRSLRPAVVVETGGTPGKSTAFILRAMARNQLGHLYTIDLPPPSNEQSRLVRRETYHESRPAAVGSNWIVPDSLRGRHTLLLGKSRDLLPGVLDDAHPIDIFMHDSDHSYENMCWEFETAWPNVKPGGLLISDDVLANASFFDFCRREALSFTNVFNLGVARRGTPGASPAAGQV
jgi:predicted O-methyltransferase YrrM